MSIKRIFCFLAVTVLLCMLCGCIGYEESDSRYIVSAIGFDADGNDITAGVEVMAVGTGSTDEEPEIRMFSAKGQNSASAVYNLGASLAKPLLMDHCGVVVLGEGLNREQIKDVFSYCREERKLNLAVYMITAKSAEELLSCKPSSTMSVGYDIMGIIERSTAENGIVYSNRFYEAEASSDEVVPIFSLPYFAVENESFFMQGERIYNDYGYVLQLDNEESLVYSFICNSNDGGNVRIGSESAKVTKSHTFFEASQKGDSISIDLDTKLTADGQSREFKARLEDAANRLIKKAQNTDAGDIFGFAERICKKDSDMWSRIEGSYEQIFASDKTEIKCSVGGDEK